MKKQGELPGIEAPSHPELDVLMEQYQRAKTNRIELLAEEVAAKDAMVEKAKELGITAYKHATHVPPLVLTITQGAEKVKVAEAPGVEVDFDEPGEDEDDDEVVQ